MILEGILLYIVVPNKQLESSMTISCTVCVHLFHVFLRAIVLKTRSL